jgi:ribosomal silencing factor RsfS
MRDDHDRTIKWEGNTDSGWILLDYGEVSLLLF